MSILRLPQEAKRIQIPQEPEEVEPIPAGGGPLSLAGGSTALRRKPEQVPADPRHDAHGRLRSPHQSIITHKAWSGSRHSIISVGKRVGRVHLTCNTSLVQRKAARGALLIHSHLLEEQAIDGAAEVGRPCWRTGSACGVSSATRLPSRWRKLRSGDTCPPMPSRSNMVS